MRVAISESFWRGHWAIRFSRQNGRLPHWPKCSCVSTKTKRWELLLRAAVCMPSLIIHLPARPEPWVQPPSIKSLATEPDNTDTRSTSSKISRVLNSAQRIRQ